MTQRDIKANFSDVKDLDKLLKTISSIIDDINDEKQQLGEYLNSLKLEMRKKPNIIKRKTNKITQKEIDDLSFKGNLFTTDLGKEYDRVFPLLLRMIIKKHDIKELTDTLTENKKTIFNLQTVLEEDIKRLHDERKELALLNIEETNLTLSQERQSTITKLISYILNYVEKVYSPIIEKYRTTVNDANSKLEQFYFTVIDKINRRIEKVKTKSPLDFKEFYFDDELKLHLIIKANSPSKYPFKVLHFNDLEITQKKIIIQILKAEVKS